MQAGIKKVIATDISKDGMLEGPATELYRTMLNELDGIYLIASGGISCLSDIETLWKANVPAVIVGKALYENRIALKDVERINIGKICWQNE
jgi:phosphoribosylformimino-5-aminoimidazole carboxamide ribotide isomerase